MQRVLGLLTFSAVAVGGYLMVAGPDPGPAPATSPWQGYGGPAVGLVVGLLLAWLVAFDWRALPQRMTAWARVQRYRLGWALIGGVCAGILLLL